MSVVELKIPRGRPAAMDSETVSSAELTAVRARNEGLVGGPLLESMIKQEFPGEIAVVSSFGAESAVLLHMVAEIDPTVPVIFLNTGKLFGETLRYRDRLQEKLGLTDIRAIGPLPSDLEAKDPNGVLWNQDADGCCFVRKVLPLERALAPFRASITGRKRFQTSTRTSMHPIEEELSRVVPGITPIAKTRFKINPLSYWGEEELNAYLGEHRLPKHPLVKDGYRSIGCMPCTDRVPEGGSYRDGRWAGKDKDECGIHVSTNMDGDGI
ncbi:MAG: phosphoadenylyl-sulfate reductase [Parvibaculaceae bacterium]|nr:phosphoadenylyl-sulfate reductase [Parvibaculaceae bacterium]